MIETAIKASSDQNGEFYFLFGNFHIGLKSYASGLLTETVQRVLDGQLDTGLRNLVLDLLLGMFSKMENPDFVAICQVGFFVLFI